MGDAPDSHQHAGAEALKLPDQLRAGLLQTVALQGAGKDHQDNGNQLGSVGNKGLSHGLQQFAGGDLSAHRSHNGGHKDDCDRLQLERKAYDHNQDAK